MHRRIIDLSIPIENFAPELHYQEIRYIRHDEQARRKAKDWAVDLDTLPEAGMHLAVETVTASSHAATHVDAPYHFHQTIEGKPARTIDEVPLEWCFGDGVLLDFTWKPAGQWISAGEVEQALEHIGYALKPLDIILFRTDAWRFHRNHDFASRHPGVSAEAIEWLIDRQIRMLGIDAWGFDVSIEQMVEALKRGEREQFFQAHYIGRRREYCHAEKLAHLDQIPKPFGFTVSLLPIKISHAGGGWCRAVAILDE